MENLDNTPAKKEEGFFRNSSKTLKAVTIGILIILLLLPMWTIEDMIRERQHTQDAATEEVSQKWSGEQMISGPYLTLSYTPPQIKEGKISGYYNYYLNLLPDELTINGQLLTQTRRRGIYEVNVYQSELLLTGTFSATELQKIDNNDTYIHLDRANLNLGISDLRGISEQITLKWGENTYVFESGTGNKGLFTSGVSTQINATDIKNGVVPYEIRIKLKGSQSLFFIPAGKTTKVHIEADWSTPSFAGNYLPEHYNVTDNSFTAQWQVLHLNRTFPQILESEKEWNIEDCSFGVNLKVPVEQYQQSTRSAKYAVLIIALTFIVIFFVEIMDKKRFHFLQYLLVGLALCLFYTLLLSLAEQVGFTLAYVIAGIMTIALIGLYVRSIMKSWRPALIISSLLVLLYAYVYVLIQLETFALLAGSLGLFVILAVLMYFSKKIDWFAE